MNGLGAGYRHTMEDDEWVTSWHIRHVLDGDGRLNTNCEIEKGQRIQVPVDLIRAWSYMHYYFKNSFMNQCP